jgi:hypothetical protein
MLLKLPVHEWMLQWYVLQWCAQMHPAEWRIQPQHLHGWTHSPITNPTNNDCDKQANIQAHYKEANLPQAHDTEANAEADSNTDR